MAKTITITTPPNTTVTLPSSDTLDKALSETVTISIANEAGETISLDSSGTAVDFTVGAIAATILDTSDSDIELVVLSTGSIDFEFEEDTETILVSLTDSSESVVERILHPIYTFEAITYVASDIDSSSPDSRENLSYILDKRELWIPSVGRLVHGDRFTRKGETALYLKKLYVDVTEPSLRIVE